MLAAAQIGPARAPLERALAQLASVFSDAGSAPITVPHLYPAEILLDLYGEDLRSRAFLFDDPVGRTELCLRPDFTVPVAQAHSTAGWDATASYAYSGAVFRRQEAGAARPVEIQQAGVETFGEADKVAADARIFALMYRGLTTLGVSAPRATIGDLAIIFAVLDALEMPDARRAALRRHVWRPARFQDLISLACNPAQPTARRADVLALAGDAPALIAQATGAAGGEELGLRTLAEITARAAALRAGAAEPRMSAADATLIAEILAVAGPADAAADRLHALTQGAGLDISDALDRFEARRAAIVDQGVPSEALTFDAAFGRSLEYYDGFVFELRTAAQTGHPPLSGGGRYDAMTTRLGADRPVPAVGAMIRPEAVLEAKP